MNKNTKLLGVSILIALGLAAFTARNNTKTNTKVLCQTLMGPMQVDSSTVTININNNQVVVKDKRGVINIFDLANCMVVVVPEELNNE